MAANGDKDRLWKLLVQNKSLEKLKDVLVVLEENDIARAQIGFLWKNAKDEFTTFIAAPDANNTAEKIASLKRILGAFQLIAYNFLGNALGQETTSEILRDVLLPIIKSSNATVVELRFEALRTCVQFIKAYETSMDEYSPAVCQAAIAVLNDRKSHDASLFAALEFIRVLASVNQHIMVDNGDDLLDCILRLLASLGDKPSLIVEASEALAQVLLISLPNSYGDLMKKAFVEEPDDTDEEVDEDLDEEESDEDEEPEEEISFKPERVDQKLVSDAAKLLMDWEPRLGANEDSNIDIIVCLLAAFSGEYLDATEHKNIVDPLMKEVLTRLELAANPAKQYDPVSFLGNLLTCSQAAVIAPYFDQTYNLLTSIQKNAKQWSKEATSKIQLKKRHKVYQKLRQSVIAAFASLLEKGADNLPKIADRFMSETGHIFGDPTLYASFIIALKKYFETSKSEEGIKRVSSHFLANFVHNSIGQLQKQAVSPAVKSLIAEAMEKLALELKTLFEPHITPLFNAFFVVLESENAESSEAVLSSIAKIVTKCSETAGTKSIAKTVCSKVLNLIKTANVPNSSLDPNVVATGLDVLAAIFSSDDLRPLVSDLTPALVEHLLESINSRVLFDEDVQLALIRIDFLNNLLDKETDLALRKSWALKAIKIVETLDKDQFGTFITEKLAEFQKKIDS